VPYNCKLSLLCSDLLDKTENWVVNLTSAVRQWKEKIKDIYKMYKKFGKDQLAVFTLHVKVNCGVGL